MMKLHNEKRNEKWKKPNPKQHLNVGFGFGKSLGYPGF